MPDVSPSTGADTAPGTQTRRASMRRVALSSLLGTAIEYYDFMLYGTVAAVVFGSLFFPAGSGSAASLAAFGTLAVGYFARPLGGMIFGHFGDRLGRKSMLIASMTMMGVASVLIGLLPGYDRIGILAPVLLVFLRLVQGIAVGGEYGGAALMVVEHADPRRRGTWASVMLLGTPIGFLLSTLAVAIVSTLPREDFLSWGWRIPFLLSAVLLVIGLYVRLSVTESPVFTEAAEAAKEKAAGRADAQGAPVVQVLRNPRLLLLACAVGIGPFALTALGTSHMIAYAGSIGYAVPAIMSTLLILSVVSLVFIPLSSWLSDRFGRRRVILTGAVGAIAWAFPLYALVDTGSWWLLTLALMVAQVLQNLMFSPITPMLSEMFGTRTRYTGVSMGYQFSSSIGAGLTPVVATLLLAGNGNSSVALSVIVIVTSLATAVAVGLLSETRGRALTEGGKDRSPATDTERAPA